MKISIQLFLVFSFYIAACQSPENNHCPFPYSQHSTNDRCGYLKVPQNPQDPNGPTLNLAYLVIGADGNDKKEDPIIFLQGGPGGITLPLADNFAQLNLDKNRDFILFDQRGTGFSDAFCTDLGQQLLEVLGRDLSTEDETQLLKQKTAACLQNMASENIKASNFSTTNNIADLEALRKHLGYKKWNLLGGSYGTRVALSYMEKHPESIRSTMLLSVFPPHLRFYDKIVSNFNNAIEQVFSLCKADTNCHKKYPNLKADFLKLLKHLENEPFTFETAEGSFILNKQDFLLLVHQMMYSKVTFVQIPSLIQSILKGKDKELETTVNNFNQRINFINLAVYWAVMATDEGNYNNRERFSNDLAQYPELNPGLSLFQSDPTIIAEWQQQNSRLKNNSRVPVSSKIPTLLVSGAFDPITPPTYAKSAAKTLENAQQIIFEYEGHTPFNACFFEIANEFLENPSSPINNNCWQVEKKLYWR